MSNVLQLIANEQKRLADKRNEKLNKELDLRVRLRKAWRASGIPDMWDQIKHIEVRNFARGDVRGDTAPLSDFVVLHDQAVVYGTGLTLYADRNGNWVRWECDETNDDKLMYRYMGNNQSRHCETLEDFHRTFVEWFARKIDPTALAALGVEPKIVVEAKSTRRILAETAAE